MSLFDEALSRARGAKQTGDFWQCFCPCHEADGNRHSPSCTMRPLDGIDDAIWVGCFAGCTGEELHAAFGFDDEVKIKPGRESGSIFYRPSSRRGGGSTKPSRQPANVPTRGCTLAAYAELKRLPAAFLASCGLSDIHYQGAPAVRIPYRDLAGLDVVTQYRIARDGDDKHRWKSGSRGKLVPYGLERLDLARKAGCLVIGEGASDVHTLWHAGLPAIGIPGASSWRESWADYLDEIPDIVIVIEPDSGGEAVLKWLAGSRIRDRVRLLRMAPQTKDPSALYLADRQGFAAAFEALIAAAEPYATIAQAEDTRRAEESLAACRGLAGSPQILARFVESMDRCGVVGEQRTLQLIYLVLTSRFQPRPVSLAVKGASSSGKSWVTEQAIAHFPPEAVYVLSSMSEHALAYSEEPLQHRHLVLLEAAGMQSDFATYLLRSLLSEGCVRYETVEKTSEGLKARLIERPGPTGLIVTTTRVGLHPENETRMLSVTVADTPDQTAAVMRSLAAGPADPPDLSEWQALQRWLALAEHRVTIPYAEALAGLVPPLAVRLRRDFGALLSLIRSHALLHQATREHDDGGCIIATLEDYAVVRELVADLLSDGVGATVSDTVRETVGTLSRLHSEHEKCVSYSELAAELHIDVSAARRRAQVAREAGYLVNDETRRGQKARLRPGDPLPEDVEILPAPEKLTASVGTLACQREGRDDPPPPLAVRHRQEELLPPVSAPVPGVAAMAAPWSTEL